MVTGLADGATEQHFWGLWFGSGPPPCDWNRAFEAYGHAMASAGALEELMILLLLNAEVFRLGKRADATTVAQDHSRMLESWQKERFNGLMNRCWKTFNLSDELRGAMLIAKNGRDHLAHQFWRGHGANLWTEDGIEIIAADCAHQAHHFRNVADALIAETGVNPISYVEMKKEAGLAGANNGGWHDLLFEARRIDDEAAAD